MGGSKIGCSARFCTANPKLSAGLEADRGFPQQQTSSGSGEDAGQSPITLNTDDIIANTYPTNRGPGKQAG